jgi:hypothetical protein
MARKNAALATPNCAASLFRCRPATNSLARADSSALTAAIASPSTVVRLASASASA